MGIPTVPESQHMLFDDTETVSGHFESDVLWKSEYLADSFEKQSKLLRNLESDQVVTNLKRILKALDKRDNTKYCFVVSDNFLLTCEGFRARTTQEEDGLQRWAYRQTNSGDMKVTCSSIMQGIKDITSKDPDLIKKRLGANEFIRDYVNKDLICCRTNKCSDNDCLLTFCPLLWPCCFPNTLLACCLQYYFGTKFGDPRRFDA